MAKRSTKRADGRMVKTITDPRTGKRKYFYGFTEREINKKIMEYTTAAESGRTFQEVAEEWWKDAEPSLAYQTVKVYKPALRRAMDEFGEDSIRDIRPRDLNAFLQRMAKEGFALRTVMNQRTVLNQIFTHAILEGDIEMNPCTSIQTPKNLKKTKRSAATPREEQLVIDNRELWMFPYIALMTGMRKGEILALQWKDIDFENDLIYVTKSVAHKGDRPFITKPKTEAGERIVPLLDDLKAFLLEQPNRIPDDYIISDTGDTPLTNRRYLTLSKHYKEQTGVECTAHQLRHSFATNAFENDVDPKSLQMIIGHRQISTTLDIYTDFREKSVKNVAKILNETSKKNSKKTP